jgi:hypothetical protein
MNTVTAASGTLRFIDGSSLVDSAITQAVGTILYNYVGVNGSKIRFVALSGANKSLGEIEVIASGANVPFADPEIFYGPTMEYADEQLSVIPDFISNCGMARVFAYLMQLDAEISDSAIFQDSSNIILEAMKKVGSQSPDKLNFSREAYRIALKKLV